MDHVRFGLLGPTSIAGDSGLLEVRGSIRRRLLIRLLVADSQPVEAARLVFDVWGDNPPPSADSTLKSHISLLRRLLGAERLQHRSGGYRLAVDREDVDAWVFEAHAAAGQRLLQSGRLGPAAQRLDDALRLWRGPALAEVSDLPWAQPLAVRLEEMRAAATEWWLDARLSAGESVSVIADAESAVAQHPLREQLWAKLMTALYLSGRQSDALRAYQRLRGLLGEELGITPSQELARLEAAILSQESLIATSPTATHPAGGSPGHTPVPAGNLPPDSTPFVDRPGETAALAALISSPGLSTMVGPGGTGKTRLAVHAARQANHLDAVWLCELAPVTTDAGVLTELTQTMRCTEDGPGDPIDFISARLGRGRQLLILDNCEHVLDGCARVVSDLIRRCPDLRILATSRTPLDAPGERLHRVPPMSIPPITGSGPEAANYESVRLFLDRAHQQQPDFSLTPVTTQAVVNICRRLDGLPLAIELAAAQLRSFAAPEIEQRLDDRFALLTRGSRTSPSRQRTLRGLLEWSLDLLTPEQADYFSRLAVFGSSFDRDAARVVAGQEDAGSDQILTALVECSLVQFEVLNERSRYRMLETVREFARTLNGSQPAHRAHARYYFQLALAAVAQLSGPDHGDWRARLEADDDNLRVAFTNALSWFEAKDVLDFSAALCRYWAHRGAYGGEMSMVEKALALPAALVPSETRASALSAAGYMYFRRGELDQADHNLSEALTLARELGIESVSADALRTCAWVANRRGDLDAAVESANQAVGAALRSHDARLVARAYDVRAACVQVQDPDQARQDYAEALRYCRAGDDLAGMATTLNNLAILELEQGDPGRAHECFARALPIALKAQDTALVPFLRYGAGISALLQDDPTTANSAFAAALRDAQSSGQQSLEAYALLGLGMARSTTNPDVVAARLVGAAESIFGRLGEVIEPTESRLLAEARHRLGELLSVAAADELMAGWETVPVDALRVAIEPCDDSHPVVQ